MRHLVIKDQFRRKKFSRFEVKRSLIKFVIKNQFINNHECNISFLNKRLFKFSKTTCFRFKNRCILTRRGRFVLRFFGLERRVLRECLLYGELFAIRKILW